MNRATLAGIALLLITGVLVLTQVTRRSGVNAPDASAQGSRDVVVAQQAIPPRMLIAPGMVRVETRDPAQTPTPEGAPDSLDDVVGKYSAVDISPGQPLAAAQLLTKEQLGLTALIPPSRRAMTIQVNDTTGVAGLVRTGDSVDVLSTAAGATEGGVPRADTLLQGVPVIAVGKSLAQQQLGSAEAANLVTLAVTPRQAELLSLEQTRAAIQLVLRPLGDDLATAPGIREAIPAERSVRQRVRVTRAVQRTPQRASRPAQAAAPRLEPLSLPPAHPNLIYPVIPPLPARPPMEQGTREGPAPPTTPTTPPPPRTVDVIRGAKRETVMLPIAESTVANHEPLPDQPQPQAESGGR